MITTSEFKFELGCKVKDSVTGYGGVIMARTQYATGCNHYGVLTTKLHEGKIAEYAWLDENRVILVGDALRKNNKQYMSGIEQIPPRKIPR